MTTVSGSNSAQSGQSVLDALAASKATAGAGEATTADQTEDRFLKLLVAQMSNQDPLNPLDNSQVTSQLAQINTVRGVEQLNTTMSKILSQQTASRALDSAGLIGRSALVDGSAITVGDATSLPVRAGFALAGDADAVKAEILDKSGNVVDTISLTKQTMGVHSFQWDGTSASGGKVASGTYTLRVSATAGSKTVDATPLVSRSINGITQAGDVSTVELAGGESASADSIRGVFQP